MNSTIVITGDDKGLHINKNIYGHFSEHLGRCIYGGIWTGKDSKIPNVEGYRQDVLEALQRIKVPVLRWPGGCFADEYHWKDGIGPYEKRPSMINTHWGGVVENNHFGTHEFMRYCELLGAEPYINGNVGSGTVREMSEWVEYMTFDGDSPMSRERKTNGRDKPWKVKYFGVGNENWGCGGNMRPEYYADVYRQYQTYVRSYGENKVFKIACGTSGHDMYWTEVLMKQAGKFFNGLSMHNYTWFSEDGTWDNKLQATGLTERTWAIILTKAVEMDRLITAHSTIMDMYDPEKKVEMIVDEWGTWFKTEPGTNPGFLYQQNTICDALVAALHFHIFHKHADRVKMANIAQTVNVLQAVILTEGDKMVKTPTYHVFEMFTPHQDAQALSINVETGNWTTDGYTLPSIDASASKDKNGTIHISLVNLHPSEQQKITINVRGLAVKGFGVKGKILAGNSLDQHNTFDNPENLVPQNFTGISSEGTKISVTLPARSVSMLEVK